MKTYRFESKTDGRINGYVSSETLSKAKYKLWIKGACDCYENFKQFLIDIDIRLFRKEVNK